MDDIQLNMQEKNGILSPTENSSTSRLNRESMHRPFTKQQKISKFRSAYIHYIEGFDSQKQHILGL